MSSAAARTRFTPQEYLDFERRSDAKHEFRDGEIVAMSGASHAHNQIAINLIIRLGTQIEDGPCRIFGSDFRVCVDPRGFYTYPDVLAVCGELRLLDEAMDTLLNPSVLIEILSPSTEAYDRGAKFASYRRIASLRDYIVVAQDRIWVEQFTRVGDDWVSRILTSLEDILHLDAIAAQVSLHEIYAKVPHV